MRTWDEILHDPRIDDSGDYDFYAIDLPDNQDYWGYDWATCDTCGKKRMIYHRTESFFYTWDSYDSMSWITCWKCAAKEQIRCVKYRLKRKKRVAAKYRELTKKFPQLDENTLKKMAENIINRG